MKITILAILLFLLAPSSHAVNLSEESIQGRWYITKMGDFVIEDAELGEDVWEFKDDQWIVHLSGVAMRPESFSIKGDNIEFSSHAITVTSFSEGAMVTDFMGLVQEFKKED